MKKIISLILIITSIMALSSCLKNSDYDYYVEVYDAKTIVGEDDFYKLCDKILDLLKNKGVDKEEINNVFINRIHHDDYIYSDSEMEIFNYLGDNTIFSLQVII